VSKTDLITEDDINELMLRGRGARSVIWRLRSRRFPKLAYRLRTAHHTGGATDTTIADIYSRPADRYALERKIEHICSLPMGSIFIHCPKRKTSMKVAEVLVVGADLSKAAQLRNLTQVSPEGLAPYEQEIRAVQDMYLSIWQFHAYLDVAFWDKQPVVEWALEREVGFPNDELLELELSRDRHGAYAVLAGALRDDIAPRCLPAVITRVDEEAVARKRLGQGEHLESRLLDIIREVMEEENKKIDAQLELPGVDSTT
jgi:hypothetical protein